MSAASTTLPPVSSVTQSSVPPAIYDSQAVYNAERAKQQHALIKTGETFPNRTLSLLDYVSAKEVASPINGTVVNFSIHDKLSSEYSLIIIFRKAFQTECQSQFADIISTTENFAALKLSLFCMAVNTKEEMYNWQLNNGGLHKVTMLPDYAGDVTFALGLGEDCSDPAQLGFVAKRAAILLHNRKVVAIDVEPGVTCTNKTCAAGLLNRLPEIMKNHSAELAAAKKGEEADGKTKAATPPATALSTATAKATVTAAPTAAVHPMWSVQALYNAQRIAHMPKQIKFGDQFPNARLTRLEGATAASSSAANAASTASAVAAQVSAVSFAITEVLSKEWSVVLTFPKGFTPTCQNQIAGILKSIAGFEGLKCKIFCLAVNTKEELYAWQIQHAALGKVTMLPDYGGDVTFRLGLGWDKSEPRHLGFIAQRSAILLYDGKVVDIEVEDSGQCTVKSSAEGLLERLSKKIAEHTATQNTTSTVAAK